MIAKFAAGAGVLAALALFGALIFAAIRNYRTTGEAKLFLKQFLAALCALLCGGVTAGLFVSLQESYAYQIVTENTVIAAYIASLVSIPVSLGWGWSAQFALFQARAGQLKPMAALTVDALVFGWLVANVMIVACVAERLAKYGYDSYRLGLSGFSSFTMFIGVSILSALILISTARDLAIESALRLIGIAVSAAALLAAGCFFGFDGLASLMQGSYQRLNNWNILIIFYPLWLILLFGGDAALCFLGMKRLTLFISRLPSR